MGKRYDFILLTFPTSFRSGIDWGGTGAWGYAVFGHAGSGSNSQERYVVSVIQLKGVFVQTHVSPPHRTGSL